jgi:hypothetical protein
MLQKYQGASFHVDHVVPEYRDGPTHQENLALSCPRCNLLKSDHVDALDRATGTRVALFSPLAHRWADHFTREGFTIVGRTDVGRATIALLDLNSERHQLIRHAESVMGR